MNKPKVLPDIIPQEGMPATLHIGSDSYAGQVTRVSKSSKSFYIKLAFSDALQVRLSHTGEWRVVRSKHKRVKLGEAINYLDPHF